MVRGLISGLGAGGVVAVLGLGALSVLAPMPGHEAQDVAHGAGAGGRTGAAGADTGLLASGTSATTGSTAETGGAEGSAGAVPLAVPEETAQNSTGGSDSEGAAGQGAVTAPEEVLAAARPATPDLRPTTETLPETLPDAPSTLPSGSFLPSDSAGPAPGGSAQSRGADDEGAVMPGASAADTVPPPVDGLPQIEPPPSVRVLPQDAPVQPLSPAGEDKPETAAPGKAPSAPAGDLSGRQMASGAAPQADSLSIPVASEFARGAGDIAPFTPGPEPQTDLPAQRAPAAPGAPVPMAPLPTVAVQPGQAPVPPAVPGLPSAPAAAEAEPAYVNAPAAEAAVPVPPPGEALAPALLPPPGAGVVVRRGVATRAGQGAPADGAASAGEAGEQAGEQFGGQAGMPRPGAGSDPIILLPDGVPVASGPRRLGPVAPVGAAARNTALAANRLPQIASAGAADSLPAAAAGQRQETGRMAILLMDAGLAAGGLDRATLRALDLPVTIVLDPRRADAAEAAAGFREAGYELAILAAGLPEGATAQDLDVALESWRKQVPGAVAVLEDEGSPLRHNPMLAQYLVKALQRDGLALVSRKGQGLSSLSQAAARDGLPHAEIARSPDAERESGAEVARALGQLTQGPEAQAAGAAASVVLLHAWPETVMGLADWQEGAPADLRLVPLSGLLAP